jgi:hypothetical protein
MDAVHTFLLNLIAYGGGSAAVAYLIFRFLGEKWIENKFERQLEADRHVHAKELQDLKKNLDSELNRALKIQEKEFDVLSESWEKLKIAENSMGVAFSMIREGINLDAMSEKEIESLLSNFGMMETHKKQIKESENKSKLYSQIIVRYELSDALKTFHDFLSYVRKNSIFIRPHLEALFLQIEEKMREAISLKKTEQIMSGTQDYVNLAYQAFKKLDGEISPLIEKLKNEIRAILHKDEEK